MLSSRGKTQPFQKTSRHYSRYCETRMLEYATRGRRSIYSTVWQTSRIFRTSVWNNVCRLRAPVCTQIKSRPEFSTSSGTDSPYNPVSGACNPTRLRANPNREIETGVQLSGAVYTWISQRRYCDPCFPRDRVLLLPSSLGSSKSFSVCVSSSLSSKITISLNDIKNTI